MPTDRPRLSLPQLDWKTATCRVCGNSFDYLGKRRPPTCKNGDCRYRWEHRINPHTWAGHQIGLFEPSDHS